MHVLLRLSFLSVVCFTDAGGAAYFHQKHSDQPMAAAANSERESSQITSSSTEGLPPRTRTPLPDHSATDPPLFHIEWPEEPLDLDSILRRAAEHQKVPWGKKVLAGRLSALTVDEADDFCARIKFAVEKHLRAVFEASTHFKVFEGMPTATPFLHLQVVRDFLRSHFTRDKIKLSLPDRDLEPLFKHAGGLPWKKNTDARQRGAKPFGYPGSADDVPRPAWSHDEL